MRLTQRLSRLTRDTDWLLRVGIGAAIAFTLIAAVAALLSGGGRLQSRALELYAGAAPKFENASLEEIAEWIRYSPFLEAGPPLPDITPALPVNPLDPDSNSTTEDPIPSLSESKLAADLARSSLSSEQQDLLLLLSQALHGTPKVQTAALEILEDRSRRSDQAYPVFEYLGDGLLNQDRYESARAAYEQSATHEKAEHSRDRLFAILLHEKDRNAIEELLVRHPELLDSASPHERIDLSLLRQQWFQLLLDVFRIDYGHPNVAHILFTLIAAFIWFSIIAQFAGFAKPRATLYLLAFILGVLSATVTLYAVVLQDEFTHLDEHGDTLDRLIFFVAGVGLREETIKLLFFLPLLPWLLKLRPVDALISAFRSPID